MWHWRPKEDKVWVLSGRRGRLEHEAQKVKEEQPLSGGLHCLYSPEGNKEVPPDGEGPPQGIGKSQGLMEGGVTGGSPRLPQSSCHLKDLLASQGIHKGSDSQG